MSERYRQDPESFMVEALDVKREHVWPKMREVIESVRDNPRTCVHAGHGVSKSYTAARLALWFLLTHYPSTVITTAPTFKQVEQILWREIRLAYSNKKIPLSAHCTMTKLDLSEKWFAIGFSTTPDSITAEATKFQGYHNAHIMVIFDEAAGIVPQIWRAAQHLLTAGFCRWLAIGNPTSDTGDFAEIIEGSGGWNVINVSVTDTPNYQTGEEVIPEVSGRLYAEGIEEKYGKDSNEYKIRVLGQKPEYLEGTFYGSRLAQARREDRVGFYPWEETAKVWAFSDLGRVHTFIIFVQFIREEIRIIGDYYDSSGLGIPNYAKVCATKPYIFQEHWTGPDVDKAKGSNSKTFMGTTVIDEAVRLGINFKTCPAHSFNDGIEAVRSIWLKLRISDKASQFLEACKTYKLKKNENLSTDDKPVYFNEPVKDWTNHPMDALRHLAVAYRYAIKVDNRMLGFPHPLHEHPPIQHTGQVFGYDRRKSRRRA
jgi:hypothetical protein